MPGTGRPLDYRTQAVIAHRPRGPEPTGSGPGIPPDTTVLRRVAAALRALPARSRKAGQAEDS